MFNIYSLTALAIVFIAEPGSKIISSIKFITFTCPFWLILLYIAIGINFSPGNLPLFIIIVTKSVNSALSDFKSIPCIWIIWIIGIMAHCNRIFSLNKFWIFIKICLLLYSQWNLTSCYNRPVFLVSIR